MCDTVRSQCWERACSPARSLDYFTSNGGWSSRGAVTLHSRCWELREHPWDSCGPPNPRKSSGNLHQRTMTALPPRTDQNKMYSLTQLAGIRTILNTTHVLTTGGRWALLHTSAQWKPVWVQTCELRQGAWLCPQLTWNPEITEPWPVIMMPL